MKGVSSGPEVGPGGNYGTLFCTFCEKTEFVVLFIRDAGLSIAICSGCGEIASALKIDPTRTKEEIDAEVANRQDVKDMVANMKLIAAARMHGGTEN